MQKARFFFPAARCSVVTVHAMVFAGVTLRIRARWCQRYLKRGDRASGTGAKEHCPRGQWAKWQGSAVRAEAPRLLLVDVIKALQREPRGPRREEARHCLILK